MEAEQLRRRRPLPEPEPEPEPELLLSERSSAGVALVHLLCVCSRG